MFTFSEIMLFRQPVKKTDTYCTDATAAMSTGITSDLYQVIILLLFLKLHRPAPKTVHALFVAQFAVTSKQKVYLLSVITGEDGRFRNSLPAQRKAQKCIYAPDAE